MLKSRMEVSGFVIFFAICLALFSPYLLAQSQEWTERDGVQTTPMRVPDINHGIIAAPSDAEEAAAKAERQSKPGDPVPMPAEWWIEHTSGIIAVSLDGKIAKWIFIGDHGQRMVEPSEAVAHNKTLEKLMRAVMELGNADLIAMTSPRGGQLHEAPVPEESP